MASRTVIDDYIETFPDDVASRLRQLREVIRAAAPGAEEAISYNIPVFRVDGHYLVYLAGWKQHVALYPLPAGPPELMAALAPWRVSKGTLRLPHGQPLPLDLVAALVKARLAEHQ